MANRRAFKYTQVEIAEYLDMSQGMVSYFANNKHSKRMTANEIMWLCQKAAISITQFREMTGPQLMAAVAKRMDEINWQNDPRVSEVAALKKQRNRLELVIKYVDQKVGKSATLAGDLELVELKIEALEGELLEEQYQQAMGE